MPVSRDFARMHAMELPIAPQQYLPSTDALVRAVKRSRVVVARTTAEETSLEGATVFSNSDRPGIRSANFAAEINLADGADADGLLTAIDEHFAAANAPCHTYDAAEAAWPVAVADLLRKRDVAEITRRVFIMRGYAPPEKRNDDLQVIPARAAYAELIDLYRGMGTKDQHESDDVADQLARAMIDRLDEPRLDMFLGRLDKSPVGIAGVLNLGDMGVIVPAYTDPDFRGKRIASTLMAAVLDHCVRAQFEQVLLDRGDGCYSIDFYQSLGFAPVADYTRFIRKA